LPVSSWIHDPAIDGGFVPTATMLAELYLVWKSAIAHFAIEGRPTEASAFQYGPHALNFIKLGHINIPSSVANIFVRGQMKSMMTNMHVR
jgi:hypothetical protein